MNRETLVDPKEKGVELSELELVPASVTRTLTSRDGKYILEFEGFLEFLQHEKNQDSFEAFIPLELLSFSVVYWNGLKVLFSIVTNVGIFSLETDTFYCRIDWGCRFVLARKNGRVRVGKATGSSPLYDDYRKEPYAGFARENDCVFYNKDSLSSIGRVPVARLFVVNLVLRAK